MNGTRFNIENTNGRETIFSANILPEWKKYLVRSARANICIDEDGSWLLQRVVGKSFNIYFIDHTVGQYVQKKISISKPFLGVYFILHGAVSFNQPQLLGIKIGTGEFGLIYTPSKKIEIGFEKYITNSILLIELENILLSRFLHFFDFLNLFQKQVTTNKPQHVSSFGNLDMLNVIQQIKFSAFPKKINNVYIEYKVHELVLLALYNLDKNNARPSMNLHPSDRLKIQQVMDDMAQNPENNFSINDLAKRYELNTDKLKQGFKYIYGNTIFGTLLKIRMELAQLLLRNTDKSIFEISHLTGYSDATAFIRAFKKYYGASPGASRKQS